MLNFWTKFTVAFIIMSNVFSLTENNCKSLYYIQKYQNTMWMNWFLDKDIYVFDKNLVFFNSLWNSYTDRTSLLIVLFFVYVQNMSNKIKNWFRRVIWSKQKVMLYRVISKHTFENTYIQLLLFIPDFLSKIVTIFWNNKCIIL